MTSFQAGRILNLLLFPCSDDSDEGENGFCLSQLWWYFSWFSFILNVFLLRINPFIMREAGIC